MGFSISKKNIVHHQPHLLIVLTSVTVGVLVFPVFIVPFVYPFIFHFTKEKTPRTFFQPLSFPLLHHYEKLSGCTEICTDPFVAKKNPSVT